MQSKKEKKDDSIKRTATLELLAALELLTRLFFFFFETKVRMWKSLSHWEARTGGQASGQA